MKTELVVATRNKKKLQEIKDLLADFNIEVISLDDLKDAPQIEEDGNSFIENAIKKAATIAIFTKKLTLGEDSGLEVKVLGNRPGIYSSRFSGKNANDKKSNLKLLRLLRNVPLKKRSAQYKCAVALIDGKKIVGITQGSCKGLIGFRSKGKSGFGYDPLFIIPKYNKTFAQLGLEIKHKMSHRAKALKKIKSIISHYLETNP